MRSLDQTRQAPARDFGRTRFGDEGCAPSRPIAEKLRAFLAEHRHRERHQERGAASGQGNGGAASSASQAGTSGAARHSQSCASDHQPVSDGVFLRQGPGAELSAVSPVGDDAPEPCTKATIRCGCVRGHEV
jgi:hypothetical protein